MPRKAKDKENLIEEKETKKAVTKKVTAKSKSTKTASKSVTKKASTKSTEKKLNNKKEDSDKKVATKKKTTKTTSKEPTSKSKTTKVTTKKETKTKTKKETTKKASSKSTAKKSSKKTSKAVTKKTVKKSDISKIIEIVEYYDLPYRYNQTLVKVLAQTPNILFVYWDISDEDKQKYIDQYGEFFFNDTKPVLIVHNKTMNYSFEVDINDFANSWYLHINDANCDYKVELGRRPINKYAKINNYLFISSSNEMDAPNDHILFDKLTKFIYFKNVKTNFITEKNISLSFLTKVGKLYNVKEFYKKMYKDEYIDFEKLNFKNMPSS